jgi:hypothetical protein
VLPPKAIYRLGSVPDSAKNTMSEKTQRRVPGNKNDIDIGKRNHERRSKWNQKEKEIDENSTKIEGKRMKVEGEDGKVKKK